MNVFEPLTMYLVALAHSGRLHRRDVRAGARLRQAERAEDRLVDERREPRRLLRVRAGDDHRAGAEAVGGDRGADAGAAPVELLADEHPVEAAEAGAADLLRDVEVHQPELVCLRDHVDRVLHLRVVLGLLRPDLLRGELARKLAQRLLLVGEGERDPGRRSLFDRGHGNLLEESLTD